MLALVSEEHQGIPRRALGYLVREHPVVVPAVHPLPHVLGADAEAGTPLLPAELATVEVAERDAPLVRSVLGPVVVAGLSREVLIDLRAGELVAECPRLVPQQVPQLLAARLLAQRKTCGDDGIVEPMVVEVLGARGSAGCAQRNVASPEPLRPNVAPRELHAPKHLEDFGLLRHGPAGKLQRLRVWQRRLPCSGDTPF